MVQQQAHAARGPAAATCTLHVKGHTRTAALVAVWGVIHREKGEPFKMPSKALYKSTCRLLAASRNWVLITTWGRPRSSVEGDSNNKQWVRCGSEHLNTHRRTQPPHTTTATAVHNHRTQQPAAYNSHNSTPAPAFTTTHNATAAIRAITLGTRRAKHTATHTAHPCARTL